ncbi:hypothetical protein DFJ74DRAFT_335518 [Hyaloraphidium curvatum]|nr:hypothetical protein DFJ74DRAFT_335518 [Hyaloraphidium curvatum]
MRARLALQGVAWRNCSPAVRTDRRDERSQSTQDIVAPVLPTRFFASNVPRGEDSRGRLLKVLESATDGRIAPRDVADRVWEAYSALGSVQGLDERAVWSIVDHVTARAVKEQARLRHKGNQSPPGHRKATDVLLDTASERVERVLAYATDAGVLIFSAPATRYIQVKDHRLGSYAECRKVADFLRAKCRMTLNEKNLCALVRSLAQRFLRLLHEELIANPTLVVSALIWNLCLKVIAEATPLSSEDLAGYPCRQSCVGDLAVPLWALNKEEKLISRTARVDSRDLHALELDPLTAADRKSNEIDGGP